MQQKRLTAALLAALATVVSADSDVTSLTKDTFNDFINSNDLVLAECMSFCRPQSLLVCFIDGFAIALDPSPANLGVRLDPANMTFSSLRSLVWPLQGSRP